MATSYELEMAVLTGLWGIDKINLDKYTRDMFLDTTEKYDKIMKYRKEGNVPGDILLSKSILGNELTVELIKNMDSISATTIPHYTRQLDIARYKQRLYDELQKDDISMDILEDGIKILKPVEEDGNLYNLSGDLHDYLENMEKHRKGLVTMYSLGLPLLDNYIYPIEAGRFIIIKALKKVGKTNLAMRIFLNFIQQGVQSLYLTSEMGYFELTNKLVSMAGQYESSKLRKYKLNDTEMGEVSGIVSDKLAGATGHIYQTGMFSINKLNDLITQTEAKIVFIDYLQMMAIGSDDKRASEYERIACQIKDIAMTKKVVFFGMSQVNKEGETKHCLAFEEKADQVIYMVTNDDTDSQIKTIDVSVVLNRHGNTGMVKMALERSTCNMKEIDPMFLKSIHEER